MQHQQGWCYEFQTVGAFSLNLQIFYFPSELWVEKLWTNRNFPFSKFEETSTLDICPFFIAKIINSETHSFSSRKYLFWAGKASASQSSPKETFMRVRASAFHCCWFWYDVFINRQAKSGTVICLLASLCPFAIYIRLEWVVGTTLLGGQSTALWRRSKYYQLFEGNHLHLVKH